MDRQAIMSRALRHGFTLRQQIGGEMDLNEYVYAFAREMFEAGRLAGVAASRKHETPPPSPCQGHARQQEADEIEQLAGGFRELLQYVEGLERNGRAPHAGHRRPITNYIRTFDAARKQSTEAGG